MTHMTANRFSKTIPLRFTENKKGADTYTKISFPIKYGIFSEIETNEYHFLFNLNQELCQAKAKTPDWIHPSEWLKRTIGNDWIYYSTGGYTGVFESIGEYYLPNLMYPSNSLIGGSPFKNKAVHRIVSSWYDLLMDVIENNPGFQQTCEHFCSRLQKTTPDRMARKSRELVDILGRRLTVLPPDARHVDYNLIPLNISDGCLYKCHFCEVKSPVPFEVRTKENISLQIKRLKSLYNYDLVNYNSLFLGEHDALNAPEELILFAVQSAFEAFEFDKAYMRGRNLFMFGSVDSFLQKSDAFFDQMNRLDCRTYINIGLESADQDTLDLIGKPLTEKKIMRAFKKMQSINTRLSHIEITGNFIMGNRLSDDHYQKFLDLVRNCFHHTMTKGSIYLSPLEFDAPSRERTFQFNHLKMLSRLPTFLYIIQRL